MRLLGDPSLEIFAKPKPPRSISGKHEAERDNLKARNSY